MQETWITRRSQRAAKAGGPEPLRHIVRYAGYGRRTTLDAACGAQVGVHVSDVYDPEHPRACRECVATLR